MMYQNFIVKTLKFMLHISGWLDVLEEKNVEAIYTSLQFMFFNRITHFPYNFVDKLSAQEY